jgi:hypothetical protein
MRMPSENYCYTKVVLNDNLPVDDSLSGREIQLIVGSPSKMAESTFVELPRSLREICERIRAGVLCM